MQMLTAGRDPSRARGEYSVDIGRKSRLGKETNGKRAIWSPQDHSTGNVGLYDYASPITIMTLVTLVKG